MSGGVVAFLVVVGCFMLATVATAPLWLRVFNFDRERR